MNVELNITMRCNQRCTNCNRLCHLLPDRTEDMSVQQVIDFVKSCYDVRQDVTRRINKVKVVGGEPLLHSRFSVICDILKEAVEKNAFRQVKISTNRTQPFTKTTSSLQVRMMGDHPQKKRHLPYLWSPQDMGMTCTGPCDMPRRCGISLDSRGYLPCSAAIMIARGFGLEHLYRDELPSGPWGMDELCRHCVHAMPKDWQDCHCYQINNTPEEARRPTPSWAKALAHLGVA